MDLVAEIYSVTKKLPKEEMYGLTSQLRRAAPNEVLRRSWTNAKWPPFILADSSTEN